MDKKEAVRMKNRISAALALSVITLGPAACSQPQEDEISVTDPSAPEGISVTNGRMLLAPVSGNPAAIYFDISNSSNADMMIRSARVEGAEMAMLHQTATWNLQTDMQEIVQQPVPAGETVHFEPGGLHVMAMEPSDTLAPGSETEVTLTFVTGDKVSFPVEIRAAGDER